MNLRPLRYLLRKEFLQIRRDHVILGMLFMMPIVQLLLLSNAATFEVRRARMYVVDQDRSPASRELVDRLAATGRFVRAEASQSVARADEAMLDRRIDMILVVPAAFGRDLARDRRAAVQVILNAEDGAAAGVIRSYAASILRRYGAELEAARGGTAPGHVQPRIDVRLRGWFNAELEYRDYMVPGILVVLVTMIGTLLTAMNIVREKEAGTLEQLNVTPITRGAFIAAKLMPLWSLALLDLAIGLAIAHVVFDVPVRGNILIVFLAAALYLVGALGIGLWISTVAETQQQAMFVTFSIMMVYMLMSGLFTPVRSMPDWAQWVAQLSPVMHFTLLMRAVLLKGAGFADVWVQFAMLGGIGVAVLSLAVRQHRKRAA